MAIISIGFSKAKSKFAFLSRLISLVEGTESSHCFVTWKCPTIERRKVFEAVGSGIRVIGNHQFKKKALVVEIYQIEVPDEALVKIDQYSHDQSGKPYGYKHILGLALMRGVNAILKPFTSKRIGNPYKDGKYSQICVEAASYVLEECAGVDVPGEIENYGLKEVIEFVKENGKEVPQEKIDRINGNL
jgi:hypothetical protein